MVSRHREESPGYGERSGLKRFLADAITIDGRNFSDVQAVLSHILAGLPRKHKEPVFVKNQEWNSGSSSSSGGEERWPSDQRRRAQEVAYTGRAS